jgi:long-chain fatty acid adenylase/transferase FadD26
MPVIGSSIPAVLGNLAHTKPDSPAFTFIDYECDPTGGLTETLSWSQVNRRVQVVAAEIAPCGSTGDRVAILAPQGLDYIVAFLAAMEAGFVAVPLSVPLVGTHDERVSAVLRDCAPVAILTTSAAVSGVAACVHTQAGPSVPALIEVDALDFDSPPTSAPRGNGYPKAALLQYTSGSTRLPAGVVVTHKNLMSNLAQVRSDYFLDRPPANTSPVSWLPFYHDMGLLLGITAPMALGLHARIISPTAFLQKPARWMQMLAGNTKAFSAAPNFAFELAARRTKDDDLIGLDLGDVHTIISGSERIHAATLRRFAERFSRFNLPAAAVIPSYGLAEATLYVTSSPPGQPPSTACFDYEKLSAGHAKRCGNDGGVQLVGYGAPRAATIRIVNSETRVENPAGTVGEIWIHGDNVADGYWRNSQASQQTFRGMLVEPSVGTPQGPWLRTGDLGVMSDGELFIVGRIKDLLIVDGRNHYPDDIEATIQEITGGRVAAISIPDDRGERLVVIVEIRKRRADEEAPHAFRTVKKEVTSAVSDAHRVRVADLVLVPPGSIPITTSGKVRRSACVERYRQNEFVRLDTCA